jgi:hypothetical protein
MTVVLATTWRPRGELKRFLRVYPMIRDLYEGLVITFPPVAEQAEVEEFITHGYVDHPDIYVQYAEEWSWGRFLTLEAALKYPSTHVHYADMDRLLRWVETRPKEWLNTVKRIQESDCLIMGRSEVAYQTHPQALIRTEAISNRVVSYFVGKQMDVSAGSKGFSRPAVEYIINTCSPGHALGVDAEWPITLHKAGYVIDYVQVDGLDWESADRYKIRAAGREEQTAAALAYDDDPENWAQRVEVAHEIIEVGIRTIERFEGKKDEN